MLPLVKDLPVALTDHLDRSPDKQLLRGRVGYIESWVLDDEEESTYDEDGRILERIPKVVFVRFDEEVVSDGKVTRQTCTWEIDGVGRPGVYPIEPCTRKWFLDQRRKPKPLLGVWRKQLPLAPAFATTAHAAQGQTLEAAIVDLQLGRGVGILASYTAITRVRRREDMLIFRPFDLAPLQRGPPRGPDLLLRVLRGEKIDWKAIELSMTKRRRGSS